MKTFTALCIVMAVVAANAFEYSKHAETFDIEGAVASADTLKGMVGCFMGTAECGNNIAKDFKKDLEYLFPERCHTCSPKQRHVLRRFMEGLEEKLPNEHADFLKRFDPEGKFYPDIQTLIAGA